MMELEAEDAYEIINIQECFVISDDLIVDFLWSRCICKVLSKDKGFNKKEQELICVLAIEYFANYHSKKFFHGDIKPDNILVSKIFELTSDAGTLLSLGDD